MGIKIPADAYRTIDYHFDWIAGAICEFAELTKQLPNDRFKSAKTKTSLVQGTQEDIDLLIAFDNTIIMVEYKAGGEWKDQLVSKERRIKSLESLVESHAKNFNIKIHPLIVCSEKKRDQDKAWLPFDVYVDKSFKRVERCDQHSKASAKGGFWHVIG